MTDFVPITRIALARRDAPWQLRRRERIAAPPEAVWAALTDARRLEAWWCDEAEVELREAGLYRCRGRSLYGNDGGAGPGRILRIEPPSRLEFTWPLFGVETRVAFELENHLEETRLLVEQSAERAPGWDPGRGASWWWVALPSLRSFVESGRPALRLDYEAVSAAPPFEAAVSVTTFPWVIWHKLTSPAETSRWWGPTEALETEPPGAFRWRGARDGPSRVLEARRESLLAHDFIFEGGARSIITWSIQETEDDVIVRIIDSGSWPAGAPPVAIALERTAWLLHLKRMSERGIAPHEEDETPPS